VRIVSIGDRRKPFGGSENSPPPPRDHRHLSDPVELVASQVAQHEQWLVGVRQQARQVRLIGLEHRKCISRDAGERPREGGDDSGRHVRT